MNLRLPLRALAHRNFQLFFAGQGVSLIGTWMQQVAMAWVVFQEKRDADAPFWLGVVGFSSQIPAFFLAPVAGAFADHWNRRRLILLTQSILMLQAFVLAGLTLAGLITVPQIIVLSIVLGLVNAFDMPTRQAFLTEMIDNREDLANAIALNSSLFNGARLIGPALAALALAITSAGICFLVNGISYLAVLAALLAMRVPIHARTSGKRRLVRGVAEGMRYAFGFAPIRAILLLVGVVSMAGMSYAVLLPVFATEVLHGEQGTYGLLMTASGLGALTGAIYLASRKTVLGLGRWILGASVMLGVGLLAFSFSQIPAVSLVLLVWIGFAMMVHMGASNTILQTIVDEDKRGRVMSLYTMAFMGMAPLGSLLAGYLASAFGPANAVRIGGLTCLAGSVAFAVQFRRVRALIRPIYMRMGILPEMPSGAYPVLAPPDPAGEVGRRQ